MSSSWIKSLSLTKSDEQQLAAGGELTADLIYSGQLLMKRLYPSQNGLQDTSYLAEKVWHSKPFKFVQVIYVKSRHWACLSNKFTSEENEVELFDSLRTKSPDHSILSQASTILQSKANKIKLKMVNVQQQSGSSDCGLFALAFAYDLCSDVDPFTKVYLQSKMRSHFNECLISEKIVPFPSQKSNKQSRIASETEIGIFCTCRQPESLPMACCDGCMEWFHPTCVPIPDEIFSNSSAKWSCHS